MVMVPLGYRCGTQTGTEEGRGAAQGCWGAAGGLEGAGPAASQTLSQISAPQEGHDGSMASAAAGPALCRDTDLSVEAGLPSPVVQQLTSCVVATVTPYRLWLSREEGSASHC